MSIPITSIRPPAAIEPIQTGLAGSAGTGFQSALASALQHVEASRSTADTAAQNFLSGGNQELHSTILASQSAELDFELMLQVRNKVVSAYEDIMRMQV